MSKAKSTLPETVSAAQLRELLGGIGISHLNGLERSGVITKAGRDQYSLASVPSYIRWLRQNQAGPRDWQSARTALAEERAAILKLERLQKQGDLLPKNDVREMNCAIMHTTKTKLLGVAPSIAARLTGLGSPAQAQEIVGNAVTEALQELAGLAAVCDGSARRRRNGHAAEAGRAAR
jgi:hypothetical protein